MDYVSRLKEAEIREIAISMPKETKAPEILNIFRGDETVKEEADIKKGEHIRVKHIL